jgi:uncharacterized glyoxalase superfamily protein PhnB
MPEVTQLSASDYGKSLKGLGFNLIVKDLARCLQFAVQVLEAEIFYQTPVFAAMKLNGQDFMFHADETYRNTPLKGILEAAEARGIGIELQVYNLDPDQAEARARQGGWTILAGSMDKPHGLREAMILDDEGYLWVPSIHLKSQEIRSTS